jgi:predicted dehydrogenase
MQKKINVGLIGTGRAGMIHGSNFAFRIPAAKVLALSDPDQAARESAAETLQVESVFADYRDLLKAPELDAVVIVTPTRLHMEIAVAAAQMGKHVLCEKPMAMTVGECDRMNSAAEAAGIKLQVGFMRRFAPAFDEAKRRVASGEIGDVVMIRSLTYGPSIPQPWMYDLKASNGPLAEVNSHDIDTLRWMADSEVTEVYATGGNYRSPEARDSFPDFYDNVVMIVKFANGVQGMISGAQGVRYGYDSRCEVLGTKGIIFAGGLEAKPLTSCTEAGLFTPAIQSWRTLFAEAYLAEDGEFISCIRENRSPRVTGFDGMRAVEVVNAGNESIRTGLPVRLI